MPDKCLELETVVSVVTPWSIGRGFLKRFVLDWVQLYSRLWPWATATGKNLEKMTS